jgi:hypothetical protein
MAKLARRTGNKDIMAHASAVYRAPTNSIRTYGLRPRCQMKVNWLKENVRHSLVSKGQVEMDKIPPLRGSSRSIHEATRDEKSEKLLAISPYENHANVPLTINAVLATNRPGCVQSDRETISNA